MAPEKQFTLFFDNVEVDADRLIGTEGDGLRQVFFGLNPERILSAATANGIGRYALDKAADYARDRSVWGTPIARHQGISHPLAKAKIEVELARLMTHKAAWYCDHDGDSPLAGEAANMAKYAAAEATLGRPRPGHPDPRRQRHVVRVRPGRHVGPGPPAAHRPGEPRDDPQLRGPALARTAPVVLSVAGARRGAPVTSPLRHRQVACSTGPGRRLVRCDRGPRTPRAVGPASWTTPRRPAARDRYLAPRRRHGRPSRRSPHRVAVAPDLQPICTRRRAVGDSSSRRGRRTIGA